MQFTDKSLAALSLPVGKAEVVHFDDELKGLSVRVTAASKRFIVRWTDPATGSKVKRSIGTWPGVTLAAARAAAQIELGKVAQGRNPAAEIRASRAQAVEERATAALTFDALIEQWSARHLSKRSPSHRHQAVQVLRRVCAALLTRPAGSVSRADVRAALAPGLKAGKDTSTVRCVAYGRGCYSWAMKNDLVSVNPFRDLPISAANVARERTLDPDEARAVWAAAPALGFPYAPAVKLLLLTLARRGEISGMRWDELSADLGVWTIPSRRSKNGKPHMVALPQAARAVLENVPRIEGRALVFAARETGLSGWAAAKRRLDAEIAKVRVEAAEASGVNPEPMEPWTFHDFRRSGVSYLASVGVAETVADRLLNHLPRQLGAVGRTYQRHRFDSERAKALALWTDCVTGHETASAALQAAE